MRFKINVFRILFRLLLITKAHVYCRKSYIYTATIIRINISDKGEINIKKQQRKIMPTPNVSLTHFRQQLGCECETGRAGCVRGWHHITHETSAINAGQKDEVNKLDAWHASRSKGGERTGGSCDILSEWGWTTCQSLWEIYVKVTGLRSYKMCFIFYKFYN